MDSGRIGCVPGSRKTPAGCHSQGDDVAPMACVIRLLARTRVVNDTQRRRRIHDSCNTGRCMAGLNVGGGVTSEAFTSDGDYKEQREGGMRKLKKGRLGRLICIVGVEVAII